MSRPGKKARTSDSVVDRHTGCPAIHAAVLAVIDRSMDPAQLEATIEADPKLLVVRDASGETPLHLALHGNPELVKMLVAKGAEVTATCDLGYTPLHRAAQRCSTPFFDALLPPSLGGSAAAGSGGGGGGSAAAAAAGGSPAVKKEEDGVDGSAAAADSAGARAIDARLHTGETALHLACQGCGLEAVRALLVRGANPNAVMHPEKNKNTPLHIICKSKLGPAVVHDAEEIIRLLVDYGGNINAGNQEGDTPLHLAVLSVATGVSAEARIVKALLANNADTAAQNCGEQGGDTPLHFAAAYNKMAAAVAIVEAAPDAVGVLNHDGESPLHLAKNKKMKLLLGKK